MTICNRSIAALVALFVLSACMTPLPKKDFPIQTKAELPASEDQIFDAVVEYVNASQGLLMLAEKAAGIISYGEIDPKSKLRVYVNVYIRPSIQTGQTVLYLMPLDKNGTNGSGLEGNLVKALEAMFKKG